MTGASLTVPWNCGYGAAVAGQRPSRRSDYTDAQWTAYLEGHAEATAYLLGIRHGTERTEPFGDLDDAGSALLMDALGQTEATTEANHAARVSMLDAYRNGLRAGRQVTS